MKLSINHHGHLELDLGCIWIQSNPLSSCILIGGESPWVLFSHFQLDDCFEFTFSFGTVITKNEFNLVFNYPLTKHNPFIFPWLTFYSIIIN